MKGNSWLALRKLSLATFYLGAKSPFMNYRKKLTRTHTNVTENFWKLDWGHNTLNFWINFFPVLKLYKIISILRLTSLGRKKCACKRCIFLEDRSRTHNLDALKTLCDWLFSEKNSAPHSQRFQISKENFEKTEE